GRRLWPDGDRPGVARCLPVRAVYSLDRWTKAAFETWLRRRDIGAVGSRFDNTRNLMDDCRQWHLVTPMARRGSSFGFMGIFGRSHDLRQLDQALRSVDVHPAVVPEAVKLTTVNLLKDHAVNDDPAPQAYRAAAEIVGYCMVGADVFAGANEA